MQTITFWQAVGVAGVIASIGSILIALIQQRKYKSVFKYLKTNLDQSITDESIEKKKIEELERSKQISRLEKQIREDIPRAAKRAVIQNRLRNTVEQLTILYRDIMDMKIILISMKEDNIELDNELLKAVRKELNPGLVAKEQQNFYKNVITIFTSISALSAIMLPRYWGNYGILFAATLLLIPISYSLIQLIFRIPNKRKFSYFEDLHDTMVVETDDQIPTWRKELSDDIVLWVDNRIADSIQDIIEEDQVNSVISETNAHSWDVDDYNIDKAVFDEETIKVELSFYCSGVQDPDRAYYGDRIDGYALININPKGEVEFEEVSAELRMYNA